MWFYVTCAQWDYTCDFMCSSTIKSHKRWDLETSEAIRVEWSDIRHGHLQMYKMRQVFKNESTTTFKQEYTLAIEYFFILMFCISDQIHIGWYHSLQPLLAAITASTGCQNWLQVMMRSVLGTIATVHTRPPSESQHCCVGDYWSPYQLRHMCNRRFC